MSIGLDYMDSGVRDSKVNPIGDLETEEQEAIVEKVGMDNDDEKSPLVNGDGGFKEELKPKKVQWNDTNGNELAEILEFWPSDMSDSDDESNSCFCTIM